MSTNVKRLLLKIQAIVLTALGLLGYAVRPSLADTAQTTMAPGQIIVRATPGMSEADVRNLAANAKCDLVKAVPFCPNFYVVRLQSYAGKTLPAEEVITDEVKAAIEALTATPGIAADPNLILRATRSSRRDGAKSRAVAPPSGLNLIPNDPLYDREWGLRAIRMPEAWAIQTGNKAIVVGVADTGIDVGHPDFANPDGTGTRIVAAANFVAGSSTVQDGDGHGTHVAGTIASTTNNNSPTGVASVAGWNRGGVDVKLVVARVLDNNGAGTTDGVISGIGYLVNQKVNVINLSLGGRGNAAPQAMIDVIKRAIDAKIVVVAAAGNDNQSSSGTSKFYPANLPGVINVTAVGPGLTKATYSTYGGTVAIAAPGGDGDGSQAGVLIWSTFTRGGATPPGYPPTDVDGYTAIQGTSMASPHVAGAAALLLAAGATQDPATIKLLLQQSAKQLNETPNFDGGNNYGAGLLDVYSALLPLSDPPFSAVLVGPQDRGSYLAKQVSPIIIQVVGVTKAPAAGVVKVLVTDLRGNVVYTYREGTDFTIPRTVPADQPKATAFQVQVPSSGIVDLAPGRYKVVLTINDVAQSAQFFDVVGQVVARGRSLFSFPFKIRDVSSSNPEQTVFGSTTKFSLARYNTLRTQQSSGDYFVWQSGGVKDRGASFSAVASTNPDVPLVYGSGSPDVSIAPVGLGYWLDLNDSVTLNTTGTPVTVPVNVKLFAANGGWNQIGTPFTAAIGWGTLSVEKGGALYSLDEAIRRGYINGALIGYENGDYVYSLYPFGELQPFKGYWVKVYTDCTLVIPTASSSRKATAPVRRGIPAVDGWRARLGAKVAGDADAQNYFGQAKGASDGADSLDVLKPPTGGGHAYLRFLSDSDPTRAVANSFDMRSSNSAKAEWLAAVSSDRTNADVTITWDNLAVAPRRAGFTLTDSVTGTRVDMKSRSSYTFRSGEAGSTRYLKVTMTPTLSAGPLAITGMTVVGGRSVADAGFTVRFSTTAEADITGAIKSLSGKTVAELSGASRSTMTGATTLRWDGRARSGGTLPPGPYLVEVTARSADGQTAKFVQPIQNLR